MDTVCVITVMGSNRLRNGAEVNEEEVYQRQIKEILDCNQHNPNICSACNGAYRTEVLLHSTLSMERAGCVVCLGVGYIRVT